LEINACRLPGGGNELSIYLGGNAGEGEGSLFSVKEATSGRLSFSRRSKRKKKKPFGPKEYGYSQQRRQQIGKGRA